MAGVRRGDGEIMLSKQPLSMRIMPFSCVIVSDCSMTRSVWFLKEFKVGDSAR